MKEVLRVAGSDGESVNARGRSDGCVFEQIRSSIFHQPSCFARYGGIEWNYVSVLLQYVNPCLKIARFFCVLAAGHFNSLLQFEEYDCRYGIVGYRRGCKPGEHSSVWPLFADLGDNHRVQCIDQSTGGFRRFMRPLWGKGISMRGPHCRSSSIVIGLATFLHSAIGTITAVSTPRRVIICGPFFSAWSMTSLSRAFAS